MELWTSYFNSMVLSIIALTDRVLPYMRERKWGRIITSTSSGVLRRFPTEASRMLCEWPSRVVEKSC